MVFEHQQNGPSGARTPERWSFRCANTRNHVAIKTHVDCTSQRKMRSLNGSLPRAYWKSTVKSAVREQGSLWTCEGTGHSGWARRKDRCLSLNLSHCSESRTMRLHCVHKVRQPGAADQCRGQCRDPFMTPGFPGRHLLTVHTYIYLHLYTDGKALYTH